MIPLLPYEHIPHAMPPDILRYHAGMTAHFFADLGADAAIAYLSAPLAQYYGVTRLGLLWYDKMLNAGVSAGSSTLGLRDGDRREVFLYSRPLRYPMIQEGIGGVEPVVRNRVDFSLQVGDDALWEDFLRHRSFARLALLERDDFIFYALLHGDEEDIFTPRVVRELQELFKPLALELLQGNEVEAMAYRRWEATRPNDAVDMANRCSGLADTIVRARRVAPTDLTVLVAGETGSGKEVLTDLIQSLSPRAKRPFVKINCGALPENLADSLLFGHEKGSFTGAVGRVSGYFEQAAGGTLFLDEVGELSPDVQAKLLRVLDRKTVRRLGGDTDIPVDFRLIAATNKDLRRMTHEGAFRQDLWYRLAQYVISVPPLRERPEDIVPLARYFAERHARLLPAEHEAVISEREAARLMEYAWPGNLRELEFVICRALVESPAASKRHVLRFALPAPATPEPHSGGARHDNVLPVASPAAEDVAPSLPPEIPPAVAAAKPDRAPASSLADVEAAHIRRVMEDAGRNINQAAAALGLHPQTLYRKWRALKD